jgi:hypothetical protein
VGLAALLSGADRYVGLDAVPYLANVNLEKLFCDLTQMFSSKQLIPEYAEFPYHAIDWAHFPEKVERLRSEVSKGVNNGEIVKYQAPWNSADDIEQASLDLIFSEGVLQCIDGLEDAYRAMFLWLKPGGYSSHAIGFSAGYLSPYWNGHWAYSDWQWRVVRGRRPFLLNREPLSSHINCAKKVGFEVKSVEREYYGSGLDVDALAPEFRAFNREDLQTSRAILILRKLQ